MGVVALLNFQYLGKVLVRVLKEGVNGAAIVAADRFTIYGEKQSDADGFLEINL